MKTKKVIEQRADETYGAYLMRLPEKDRKCSECGGPITCFKGCGGCKVPTCEKCNLAFRRGVPPRLAKSQKEGQQ